MEKLLNSIDDVIDCIKHSQEYKKCLELQDKMSGNSEITELVKKIKFLQKKYIKSNYSSSVKEELDKTNEQLMNIPVYVMYLGYLEKVNYKITLKYNNESGIPQENVFLQVIEIENNIEYIEESSKVLNIEKSAISSMKLFDIYAEDNEGNIYQPNNNVQIEIKYIDTEKVENELSNEESFIVHLPENDEGENLESEVIDDTISFETPSFSIFIVTNTKTIENTATAIFTENTVFENDDITISGNLPADCIVEAFPVNTFDSEMDAFLAYDINIYANEEMKDLGIKWQPDTTSVKVMFQSTVLSQRENVWIYHIDDENNSEFIAETIVNDNCIEFDASSFSVYALVDVENPVYTLENAQTLSEITDTDGFFISVVNNGKRYYVKNSILSNKGCLGRTDDNNITSAAIWYFEPDNDKYGIYTNLYGEKKYIKVLDDTKVELTTATEKSLFEVEMSSGKFSFKSGENYFNYSQRNNGFKTYPSFDSNCEFDLTYTDIGDPYSLDGKEYIIMNMVNNIYGYALKTDGSTISSEIINTKREPIYHSDYLIVDRDSLANEWKFHASTNGQYILSTTINNITKYLAVNDGHLTITDSYESAAKFRVSITEVTGTPRYLLLYEDRVLSVNGNGSFIIRTASSYNQNDALAFGVRSEVQDEDFINYKANLIDISSPELKTGDKVIMYARLWNNSTLSYEYYIVDYDGSMIPATHSGETIGWVGSHINTPVLEFVEYFYDDGVTPNYYYDFQNLYTGEYLAPSIGGSIYHDSPVGVNLNGRRYNHSFSTVLAWDDAHYCYASLIVDENKEVTSGNKSEAYDFYLAVLDETPEEEKRLTTITDVINNEDFGITMTMQNYGAEGIIDSAGVTTSVEQDRVLGARGRDSKVITPGLLSTFLVDGYPVAVDTGTSLYELYNNAREANHLFPLLNYYNSGYFEYDSSVNFATIDSTTGDFVLYNNLGTTDISSRTSLKHGIFLPYNDLTDGSFASVNSENLYTPLLDVLSSDDPRKYEKLYLVPTPDYYYGMEMSVDFIQSPDGLDSWNHDIIFEFTGDDDFWLYLDDQLVLDIGGIHVAKSGNINFRTGEVKTDGVESSLKLIFEKNYKELHPDATQQEVDNAMAEIFTTKDGVHYAFKDNSTHNMKIFYMERGASSANLRIKFNVISVKENQVLLEKKITGTESTDYRFAKFPYQIFWSEDNTTWTRLSQTFDIHGMANVVYTNDTSPVDYLSNYNPAGTTLNYGDVFFLQPGGKASITFPEEAKYYKIVEVGVNTNIYDSVYINNDVIQGAETLSPNRSDFSSDSLSVSENHSITYTNHVSQSALRNLSIKKILLDENGQEVNSSQDGTPFSFRLYFKTELDNDFVLAYLQNYHVRNEAGFLCVWDSTTHTFVSTGKINISQLTAEEKENATFQTSSNGAISEIPAGYTVEIYEVPIGTKFKIEERSWEVPNGYKFEEYQRVDGTYIIEDADTLNSGTVRESSDPTIRVVNRRGYELSVEKKWSDDLYTEWHDDIYVAVYSNDALVPNTVKKLTNTNRTADYYFSSLPCTTISACKIREVVLTGDGITETDGIISGYDTIDPVIDDEEMPVNTITGGVSQTFQYTASYEQKAPEGKTGNIQKTIITNTRPGFTIVKEDFEGNKLAGAKFTLSKSDGTIIGNFTSDANGFVAMGYFDLNTDYRLEETRSPTGYYAYENQYLFSVDNQGVVDYTSESTEGMVIDNVNKVITIKNKALNITLYKQDENTKVPLENAVFSIYKNVNGHIDINPLQGFSNLTSNAQGLILNLNRNSLAPGSYYLKEISAPSNYKKLTSLISFSVSNNGEYSFAESDSINVQTNTTATEKVVNVYVYNTYSSETNYNMTIRKNINGNFGNKSKYFKFQVNVSGTSADALLNLPIVLTNASEQTSTKTDDEQVHQNPTSITLDSNGTGSTYIWLSHNESIEIDNLPLNIAIEVIETNEDYTPTIQIETDGTTTTRNLPNTGEIIITDDVNINYTNTKQGTIVTGNNILRFMNLFSILFGIAILKIIFKRKKYF